MLRLDKYNHQHLWKAQMSQLIDDIDDEQMQDSLICDKFIVTD